MDLQWQWIFLSLGFFLLVILLVYNKIIESRQRRRSRQKFADDGDPAPTRSLLSGRQVPRIKPVEPAPDDDAPDEMATGNMPEHTALRRETDALAALMVNTPVRESTLWQQQKRVLAGIARQIRWLGLDEERQAWNVLQERGSNAYRQWRVGVQLADRRGPMSDTEVHLFHEGMDLLARELNGSVRYQPLAEILGRTDALNRFSISVDVQIGISLVRHAQETFALSHIDKVAREQGLVLHHHHYEYRHGDGTVIFTLANMESGKIEAATISRMNTRGMTFLFDVPLVQQPVAAFDQMISVASTMAQELGGKLVDDNRQPVTTAHFTAIRDNIAVIAQRMDEWRIEPGGPMARRLFS